MIIKYSAYKYAPETAAATVNGVKIDLKNTMIPAYICSGNGEKARQELKKAYRKQIRTANKYIYCFFAENSKQFYYIACLSFGADEDIKSRLYCYKELKHHLQQNPPTITTESGYITPTGATAPKRTTEAAKIDFSKVKKIRIA